MMEWLISKIENPEPTLTKLSIGFWKRNIISDVPVLSSHATQCFSWQLNYCNSFVIGHFRTDGSDGCMLLLVPKSCGTLMEKYLLYEEITLPKHFLNSLSLMIPFNPCSSGPDRSVVSQSTGNSRWTLRVARVQYNSQILMQQDPVAAERFLKLMTDTEKIVLHEDYAGVGTCGVTMVQQFNSFKASLATKLPPGDPLASQEQLKIFRAFNF